MRIGTWNVDYALASDLKHLHARCEEHPADLWIVTETHDDFIPNNHPYRISTQQRPEAEAPGKIRADSRWVSISSKFPLSKIEVFKPLDSIRTVVARLDMRQANLSYDFATVYGTVLPWRSNSAFRSELHKQASEWRTLKQFFPDDLFCVAGDFNTDMGAAPQFNIREFFRTKIGRDEVEPILTGLGLRCVTIFPTSPNSGIRFPPIDHIAISSELHRQTKIAEKWAGKRGSGETPKERIGLVVEVSA